MTAISFKRLKLFCKIRYIKLIYDFIFLIDNDCKKKLELRKIINEF